MIELKCPGAPCSFLPLIRTPSPRTEEGVFPFSMVLHNFQINAIARQVILDRLALDVPAGKLIGTIYFVGHRSMLRPGAQFRSDIAGEDRKDRYGKISS